MVDDEPFIVQGLSVLIDWESEDCQIVGTVANGKEALREVEEDILEGADMIIAKPALGYMDVMKEIALNFNIPIVAYNVSGEYAMVKAAAMNGWIDEKKIVMENMTGFKRAGAKMIITYHAIDVAKWLKEE